MTYPRLLFLAVFIYLSVKFVIFHSEENKKECLYNLLSETEQSQVEIDTKGRSERPVIRGMISIEAQKILLSKLQGQCGTLEIHNFMTAPAQPVQKYHRVTVKVDKYNQTIQIDGQIASSKQQQELLQVLQSQYPEMELNQLLQVDKTLEETELADQVALALTQVDPIEMTEITFSAKELILKGLVRDKEVEARVLEQFHSLFEGELNVINQLERVVKNETLFDDLEIELGPIPEIEPLPIEIDIEKKN